MIGISVRTIYDNWEKFKWIEEFRCRATKRPTYLPSIIAELKRRKFLA